MKFYFLIFSWPFVNVVLNDERLTSPLVFFVDHSLITCNLIFSCHKIDCDNKDKVSSIDIHIKLIEKYT